MINVERMKDLLDQKFPTSDASMFIQWKGTNVCLDFHCPCGASSHIDSDFAYFVQCGACGATFQMGTQVVARRVEDADGPVRQTMIDPL